MALKPGMTATVDIRTGRRSVLKYLAKPVYKAFAGAMNEREGVVAWDVQGLALSAFCICIKRPATDDAK